ncbi:hypothetical protein [Aquitalea sp. LB_tupeE]|uniref:hypothetical protein n=1 Tax=Aquitalea sp. LB_tupeE TaxID=2748078 RepID=UPI0015BC2D4D|nr:hypothetical protein [Aquitalea sp. LB_tupeE]NWK78367.1 hypothetical protein [Aquitalea sp. LB_tupeE]
MHTLKPRNPYACSPLLKKGGAHQRSQSGQRQHARQAIWAELDDLDWIDIDHAQVAQHVASSSEDDSPGSFYSHPTMPKAASQRPLPCYSYLFA